MTDETIPHKTCTACLQSKPLTEFYICRKRAGAFQARCKTCDSARKKSDYLPYPKPARPFCPVTHRQCGECKTVRLRSDFTKGGRKDGLSPQCRPCQSIRQKLYRQTPEGGAKHRAYNSAYAKTEKAKERMKAYAAIYTKTERANTLRRVRWAKLRASPTFPLMQRGYRLKCFYGITVTQYIGLFFQQGGVCAICGEIPVGRPLYVDHDHKTGKVRGLLCNAHNLGLGHFNDDPNLLLKAHAYLIKHKQD